MLFVFMHGPRNCQQIPNNELPINYMSFYEPDKQVGLGLNLVVRGANSIRDRPEL